jgi:hypothetical protein
MILAPGEQYMEDIVVELIDILYILIYLVEAARGLKGP